MIRMHRVSTNQLKAFDLAGAEFQVAVFLLCRFDYQHRAFDFQRVESRLELLGLRLFHVQSLHYDQCAVGKLGCERRAQRTHKLFTRERVVEGTRLRSVDGTAVAPEWRTD